MDGIWPGGVPRPWRGGRTAEEFTEVARSNLLIEMAEEEFWALDPALIYSIFEHKVDMAKEIIKRKGDKMGK